MTQTLTQNLSFFTNTQVHSGMAIMTGVGTFIILEVLRVPLSTFFGLMAFLLEFIPNIGAIIATFLPLPIVILSPEFGYVTIVLAFALPAALHVSLLTTFFNLCSITLLVTQLCVVHEAQLTFINFFFFEYRIGQFFLGQMVEPRVLGAVMEVPALTVLVCLMFWGSVWGIIGAILSVCNTCNVGITFCSQKNTLFFTLKLLSDTVNSSSQVILGEHRPSYAAVLSPYHHQSWLRITDTSIPTYNSIFQTQLHPLCSLLALLFFLSLSFSLSLCCHLFFYLSLGSSSLSGTLLSSH